MLNLKRYKRTLNVRGERAVPLIRSRAELRAKVKQLPDFLQLEYEIPKDFRAMEMSLKALMYPDPMCPLEVAMLVETVHIFHRLHKYIRTPPVEQAERLRAKKEYEYSLRILLYQLHTVINNKLLHDAIILCNPRLTRAERVLRKQEQEVLNEIMEQLRADYVHQNEIMMGFDFQLKDLLAEIYLRLHKPHERHAILAELGEQRKAYVEQRKLDAAVKGDAVYRPLVMRRGIYCDVTPLKHMTGALRDLNGILESSNAQETPIAQNRAKRRAATKRI